VAQSYFFISTETSRYSHHHRRSPFANELEAVRADPIDGPQHSREYNIIGMKYEIRLQTRLREMDIPFETENELRIKGTAKTPDIL